MSSGAVTARSRWCHHVDPATAEVWCNGERHRVTWRRGKLVLENHDLTAERMMLAFGGEPCPCLQVLQLWRDVHTWAMSLDLMRQMKSNLPADALLTPGELARVNELTMTLRWDRQWRRAAYFSEHERLLQAQLRSRALGPLRQHLSRWKERAGFRLISSLDLRVARRSEEVALEGRMDRVGAKATATLGAAWLLEVWARGLAVVDDFFVLEVDGEESPTVVTGRAVRWQQGADGAWTPVVVAARLERQDEGTWRMAEESGGAGRQGDEGLPVGALDLEAFAASVVRDDERLRAPREEQPGP